MPKISSSKLNQELIARKIKNLPMEIQILVLKEYLKELDADQALEMSQLSQTCQSILRDRSVWINWMAFTESLLEVIAFYQDYELRYPQHARNKSNIDYSVQYMILMKNEASTFHEFVDFMKQCKSFLLDPRTVLFDRITPFILAAAYNRADLIKTLILIGADVNQSDSAKVSALHYAVRANAKEVVTLLLQENVNVNLACNCGNTPLHYIRDNDPEIPIKLILSGANPDIMANNKTRPLDYAKHFNFDQVVSVLKQANAFNTIKPLLLTFKKENDMNTGISPLVKFNKKLI